MTKYPVRVPLNRYSGRDPRKLKQADNFNRIAARIQKYINDEVEKWADNSIGSTLSCNVAASIHEDNDLVHVIIAGIEGGANGVTIYKGDYERAMNPQPRLPERRTG
jgi:hypothetical protein